MNQAPNQRAIHCFISMDTVQVQPRSIHKAVLTYLHTELLLSLLVKESSQQHPLPKAASRTAIPADLEHVALLWLHISLSITYLYCNRYTVPRLPLYHL